VESDLDPSLTRDGEKLVSPKATHTRLPSKRAPAGIHINTGGVAAPLGARSPKPPTGINTNISGGGAPRARSPNDPPNGINTGGGAGRPASINTNTGGGVALGARSPAKPPTGINTGGGARSPARGVSVPLGLRSVSVPSPKGAEGVAVSPARGGRRTSDGEGNGEKRQQVRSLI